MEEDFMFDGEEETTESPNRRNFLIIVGILGALFLAAMICNFTLLNRGNDTQFAADSTAIANQNATIAAQNSAAEATWTAEAIQAAIDATNDAQPQPTETAELEPTNTESAPDETPIPTETAVVKTSETATPNISGTSEFDGDNEEGEEGEEEDGDETATPDAIIGSNSSGGSSTATPISSTSDPDALPDTGINTWGTILVGLILIGVLIGARRIRQA